MMPAAFLHAPAATHKAFAWNLGRVNETHYLHIKQACQTICFQL